MKQFKSFCIFIALALCFSCKQEHNNTRDLSKNIEFRKDTLLQFIQDKDTLETIFEVELAKSDYEKETGLMNRKEMKTNRGMLFIYEEEAQRPSFYMKNTYIPLDLVYLDKDMKIVDFNLNTTPLSQNLISSKVPSIYVLELNAGVVEKFNLKQGDKIVLK